MTETLTWYQWEKELASWKKCFHFTEDCSLNSTLATTNYLKWKIMQRDILTEFHSPKIELKNSQNTVIKNSTQPCHALQENNEHVKDCDIKSLHYESETPSAVSKLAEINSSLPVSIKHTDTANKQFILTNPLILVDKSLKNGKILNLNGGIYQLPKKSSKLSGRSVTLQLASTGNNNSANNAAKTRAHIIKSRSNTDAFNNKYPTINSNESNKTKPPCAVVVIEPKGNTQLQLKLDTDFNKHSANDSLPLNSSVKSFKFRSKNDFNLKESGVVSENISNDHVSSSENEPFCVISEVVGNADVAFSCAVDSHKNLTKSLWPQIITSKKSPYVKEQIDSTPRGACGEALGTLESIDGRSDPAFSDIKAHEANATGILETEAVPSCKINENKDADSNNFAKVREIPTVTSKEDPIVEYNAAVSDSNDIREMTAEISGTKTVTLKKTRAERAFASAVVSPKAEKPPEIQLITPKKTNDITKIKGWRRKQFLVEKPTTVEFYRIEKGSKQKKKLKVKGDNELLIPEIEEPGNVENAFVCDSLDEFLDREVELKVGYEIPHLYAEIGIKLTSEDIASKPNLSDKDFKEVESRYCIPVKSKNNIVNLDEIDEENFRSGKRHIEDDPKPFKFLKLQESKRQSGLHKHAVKLKIEKKENAMFEGTQEGLKENGTRVNVLSRHTESVNNVKLGSKLLGLVVYPGPFKPLHPIVQHHIEKLRSYSTRIDKNWATFAASAVFVNDKHYKRRILPVHCCVKIEKYAKGVSGANSIVEKEFPAGAEGPKSTKYNKEKIKLKKCHVVIDKINLVEALSPWCMEHHTYDCEPCGLSKRKFDNFKSLIPCMQEKCTEKDLEKKDRKPAGSPQASFDKKIANLLARKLRILKFRGDTLTSIDCLKKLVPDSVEFIKLNFVKESFLSAYVSIWFLREENPWTRSRAFLTFSKTPPMPNAVNLKSNTFCVKNLPKVITEIVSSDNVFSPNEYAILHCNGEIWEIHGSLNIAFGKSDKNVEQIFASLHIPELKQLQKVAQKILKVKAVKWWVVDLSQKFKLIEIKFGNVISVMSRNKFLESAKYDSHGFIPIRRNSKGRILGAYIIRPLLPFVLMGPYYLLETHNMTLKGERSTLPFMYFVKENVMKDSPLKFFINSVIKDVEENDKVLDGLWLYDKMRLDSTSYIEVMTRNLGSPVPSKFSSIDIEHGYSLSSLTNCLPPGVTAGVVKRKDGQEELKRVTVYLYFDVFELGYVEGELQRDNSVIICHPLDRRTKVKSHRVGDWFVRTIKRRIEFIPKDMEVKWFITKHKEDLRERRPFNKFLLGGAHVLTKSGVFYLLEMSESSIAKLGLEKNEVVKAIMESQVLKVVLEMKKLASLLSGSASESSSMAKVLTMAISEIERLRSFEECLKKEKIKAEEKKLNLLCGFLQTLSSCQVNDQFKLKMIENIEHLFIKEDGDLSEEFIMKLRKFRIGRKYFRWNRKCFRLIKKVRDTDEGDAHSKTSKSTREKCKKLQFLLSSIKQLGFPRVETLIKKSPIPEGKSPNIAEAKEDVSEFPSTLPQQKSFNPTSVKICRTKNMSLEKTSPLQNSQERSAEGKKVKCNEIVTRVSKNSIVVKGDGFLRLTSPGLPENIKLCWKDWKS